MQLPRTFKREPKHSKRIKKHTLSGSNLSRPQRKKRRRENRESNRISPRRRFNARTAFCAKSNARRSPRPSPKLCFSSTYNQPNSSKRRCKPIPLREIHLYPSVKSPNDTKIRTRKTKTAVRNTKKIKRTRRKKN